MNHGASQGLCSPGSEIVVMRNVEIPVPIEKETFIPVKKTVEKVVEKPVEKIVTVTKEVPVDHVVEKQVVKTLIKTIAVERIPSFWEYVKILLKRLKNAF